jgi:hypothetical protein
VKFGFVLVLVGLSLEMFGALLLSVEAIGLDRVEAWARSLGVWREQTDIHKTADPRAIPKIQSYLIGINVGLGILAGGRVASGLDTMFGVQRQFVSGMCGAVIGGLIAAYVIPLLIKYLLSFVIFILRFAEQRTRVHRAGVIGFLFLLGGFTFQFIGTLIDGLIH